MKRFLFVGDIMLGRLVNAFLKQAPPDYVWGDILSLFKKADVNICNLECVLSNRGEPWTKTPKVFHFRSDAKNIAVLKEAGISAVSLANNHTLDFEYEGMKEMLEVLNRANIFYAGAGDNIEQAKKPAVWEVDDKKIGFIAFTDNEPDWEAKKNMPGIYFVPTDLKDQKFKDLFKLIKDAKKDVDFLIVSAHWGPNWGYAPPWDHLAFGRRLIDAGADVIFGHSAHVVRGIEIYKDKPILYSTGDFIDDYAVDDVERNDESFIFVVNTDEDMQVKSLDLFPTTISNFQANLAIGSRQEQIAGMMQKLCKDLGTKTKWQKDKGILNVKVR